MHNNWVFAGIAALGQAQDLINIYRVLELGYQASKHLMRDDIIGYIVLTGGGGSKKVNLPQAALIVGLPLEKRTDISQSSRVTIFKDSFIANFLESMPVKEFLKIGQYLMKI